MGRTEENVVSISVLKEKDATYVFKENMEL